MKFPRMHLFLVLFVIILSFKFGQVSTASASAPAPRIINAASCNASDVQRALNQAHEGDTVAIPAGTCTWTGTLAVSTAVNLLGSATGTTELVDNVDRPHCSDHPLLFMNISVNQPWRLAQLTIQGSAPDPGGCSEHIKAVTNSHAFRIDHITFNNMQSTGILVNGDAWGVIDHSIFNGAHKRGVLIHHTSWGQVGAWGDNSWSQPDTMGTNQAVFVEDSTFNITHASGAGSVACEFGGRCVARYNTLPYLGTHGNDSGQRMRSIRQFEVYNNIITDYGSPVGQAMQLRGGTSLFFNNTVNPTTDASYKALLALEIYREVNSWTPWGPSSNRYKGGCDGTGPFDSNLGTAFESGTFGGGAGVQQFLADTTKHWTTNQWIGYSVHNSSANPWGASIQSNTATTIIPYPAAMGPAHIWNPGDNYQILRVYPCLDQPGRGMGDYISGGGYAMPPTPVGWPHQAMDPVYAWNNRSKQTLTPAIGHYFTHVQANRDYYDWTPDFDGTSGVGQGLFSARPATCTPLVGYWATDTNTLYQCSSKNSWTVYYRPYTYPHPLQGTSAAPPTELKVIGVH
jgi:hypothetical protein